MHIPILSRLRSSRMYFSFSRLSIRSPSLGFLLVSRALALVGLGFCLVYSSSICCPVCYSSRGSYLPRSSRPRRRARKPCLSDPVIARCAPHQSPPCSRSYPPSKMSRVPKSCFPSHRLFFFLSLRFASSLLRVVITSTPFWFAGDTPTPWLWFPPALARFHSLTPTLPHAPTFVLSARSPLARDRQGHWSWVG